MSKHENHDHNRHGEVTVETLSTPLLRVKPAPLGQRVGAGVVDSFIIGLVWGILAVLFRQDVRTATQLLVVDISSPTRISLLLCP